MEGPNTLLFFIYIYISSEFDDQRLIARHFKFLNMLSRKQLFDGLFCLECHRSDLLLFDKLNFIKGRIVFCASMSFKCRKRNLFIWV